MIARKYTIFASLFVLLFLTACGGSGRLRHTSPQEAYEQGKELFDRGRYERASEYFQAVFTYGRQNEYAADAQYYLAWSHYNDRQYIVAASEFNRFAQMYRLDPRVPEAEYQRAVSYYQQSPGYQLDQTSTHRALDELYLFINRFPEHPLVEDAEEKITELRDKLARKDYETAGLYERRRIYDAAAYYFERVFDKYPESSPWAERALIGAIENYILYADESVRARQAERLEMAMRNYERLVQLFPESELRDEAERLRREISSRMETLASN
ncbi:MAG: outer membrane protein assembly factor BamD [Bacteroidota bacterium]